MKTWLMIAVVVALVVVGFAAVGAIQGNVVADSEGEASVAATCGGGCSAGNTCSNAACGAKVGKSCGCGGR
ncbi:hypothetical protein HN935_03370 [archaeon]|jgi:hypothetical protein|nr:hypothetical protein [archaeon]